MYQLIGECKNLSTMNEISGLLHKFLSTNLRLLTEKSLQHKYFGNHFQYFFIGYVRFSQYIWFGDFMIFYNVLDLCWDNLASNTWLRIGRKLELNGCEKVNCTVLASVELMKKLQFFKMFHCWSHISRVETCRLVKYIPKKIHFHSQ